MKIKFVEPHNPRQYPKSNLYLTSYGWMPCFSLYDAWAKEILIVKQNNLVRTIYLLLHELGHWIIDMIFKNRSIKFHILYDKIDTFIVRWNV